MITHEEYIKMVKENNPYVEIIGKYNGMRNKIKCKCKICNAEYDATAYDVKIGKKHSACASKISGISKRKTNDVFIEQLANIQPNIKVLENYIDAKTKINVLCLRHNEEFMSDPDHLLAGKCGCSQCRSEKIINALSLSNNQFIERMGAINNNIIIVGEYINSTERIEVECKKCGFHWFPTAGSLLSGNGCPKCVGRYKTTDEFIAEMAYRNPDIEILGEYINTSTKIQCRCKVCGNIWNTYPKYLYRSGCPECNLSHGEKRIKAYLLNNYIDFEVQKTFDGLVGIKGGLLSYDFYISNSNTLIEYQGEFHDGTAYQQTIDEYNIQQEHDKRKRDFAVLNNYNLIEIWYYDYDNIEEILERNL